MRALAAALALLLTAAAAEAQTATGSLSPSTAIVADRFAPGVGPNTLFAGEAAETTPFANVSSALSLGYLRDPIHLSQEFVGTVISRPVTGQLVADLSLEAGVWKRVALAIGLPVVLYATGDRLKNTGGDDSPLAAPAGGDLRLRVKVAFAGDPRRAGLHVAALLQLTFPLGGQSDFAASDGVTVEPRLVADLRYGRLLVAAQLGVRFQGERALFATRFGDELTWLGGARLELVARGRASAALVAEVAGLVGPGPGTRPCELRAGLRGGFGAFSLELGAGGGLVSDVAAPAWRVFAVLRHHFDVR